MNFSRRLAALLFVFTAVRLLAVNPVPYTEAVSFSFKIGTAGWGSMTVYDEVGGPYLVHTVNGVTEETSTMGTAWLRPGKQYQVNMHGDSVSDFWLSFIAPAGYTLYVQGAARDLVHESPGGGLYDYDYTIELRPVGSGDRADIGAFSGISMGRSVTWEVALGGLLYERSAGRLIFKEQDFSSANNPASRQRLYTSIPSNSGEAWVINDGSSNQTLRQVIVPSGVIDLLDDVSGGYWIRFFLHSQSEGSPGNPNILYGSPWKTIRVESSGANHLKLTETEGSAVRVSEFTASGTAPNQTWTLQEGGPSNNWLRTTTHASTGLGGIAATGGTVTNSGGYTIHTFTSSGTFAVTSAPSGYNSLDTLLVAGGGGGGGGSGNNGGGGGGGGGAYTFAYSASATNYTINVGAGGSAGSDSDGGDGGWSQAFGSYAWGGGGGGAFASAGHSGGAGGGAGRDYGASIGGGTGSQGGNGGGAGGTSWSSAGGGGGAAGSGSGGNGQHGGNDITSWSNPYSNGGQGISNAYGGSALYYGGGGAGCWQSGGGRYPIGGMGGGGDAGGNGVAGGSGTNGRGGGGAGGQYAAPGAGGSGVVIVRYQTSAYREVVETVRTGGTSGTIVSKTKYKYENVGGWGEELTQMTADPDSAALLTAYTYHTNSANRGNYRRIKSVTVPTGGWTAWEYYDDWDRRRQLKYQFQPWLDSPSTAASASTTTGRVQYYEYTSDWTGRHTRPTLREERTNNVVTGKNTWTHGDSASGGGWTRETALTYSYGDASNYRSDYTEHYRADSHANEVGLPYIRYSASQRKTSSAHGAGTFNSGTGEFTYNGGVNSLRKLAVHGSTSSSGADWLSSWSGTAGGDQPFPGIYLIPNQSTLEARIIGFGGLVLRTETWVYTGSGNFDLLTYENFTYNDQARLTSRVASNGATTTYTYTDGRLTSTTDATGIETQFTSFDPVGRVLTSVKKGASAGTYAAQGDITTTNTYDGANRVTQAVVSGGALSQTTTSQYDKAGRLTQTVAPGGYTTGIGYSSGGRVVTTTFPGGKTKVSETWPDGQLKQVTGTGVVHEFYTHGVDGSGNRTLQSRQASSTTTAVATTTADWLGRPITEERPAPPSASPSTFTVGYTYNSAGQLTKRTETGLADTLYSYDTLGGLVRSGLDVGGNGTLDLASSDRITDQAWTFFPSSGNWWRRQTTSTYATTSSGTATQLGKVEVQISGLPSNRFSRTDTTDIFGNVTSQFVDVNRSGKLVTSTTDAPDSTTDAVQIAYNGLVVSARSTANHTTTFGFDDLGRPVTSVDPRIGTTTTAYISGTSQVYTVTDPASIVQATYTYDSAGRVASVKDALNKYTYTSYTDRGEVYRQWGDATYPVEYGYDTWGRRTTMNTYRAGTGWTSSTWPGSPGTADTTTWAYHEASGTLTSKTDAGGKVVSYTYTTRGQLDVRTWARGVTTDYGYSSTTAELLTVDYSDSTTDLTYTYNRLGNQATVVDATGTRTFTYNLAGTLELQREDLPSFFGSRRITYPVASSGVVGRSTGLQLGTSGSPTSEQSVTYGYDTSGRFNSFAGGGTTLAYTYTTNSNLIGSIADTSSGWTQTRSYLSNRDLLDVIETKVSTTTKAKFDYAHDNLGRRTSVEKDGPLYGSYGSGTQGLDTTWAYDDRSQVTGEVTKLGGSVTVLTGREDAYAWDNIGNRSSTTHNSSTGTYSLNSLNQYTQRTVPGVFDVAGAATGNTVTVTKSGGATDTAARHGKYFFDAYALTNTSAPVAATLDIADNSSPPETGSVFAYLPKTPEAFTYDDDGNLTRDGRWVYVYDAENRLSAMFTRGAPDDPQTTDGDAGNDAANTAIWNSGLTRQKLVFTYDYLGRRVDKLLANWEPVGSTWVPSTEERFVYNGWNAMAKLNALSSNALVASYYWGLDWSGTLQGAGGVGGLALTVEGGNTYLPMFDGNGNVMGSITTAAVTLGSTSYSAGDIVAAYEYDAFGNTLRESGAYAASNPWRFSTKYTDTETTLVYYGLRYYSPTLGRFINKDPIEEQGGLNLYAFCGNNGVNRWDYLGMNAIIAYDGGAFDDVGSGLMARMQAAIDARRPDWVKNFGDPQGEAQRANEEFRTTRAMEQLIEDVLEAASRGADSVNGISLTYRSDTPSVTLGPLIFEGEQGWDARAEKRSSATAPGSTLTGYEPLMSGADMDAAFGDATSPDQLLVRNGRGGVPSRGNRQVRVGNGGLFSGEQPSGKPGPFPYSEIRNPGDPRPPPPRGGYAPQQSTRLITNPKHHPNSSSPQPLNAAELYARSIPDSSGVRWSIDSNGVIHRFSRPSNNTSHWNGSTAGDNPIQMRNVPNEILKELKPGG